MGKTSTNALTARLCKARGKPCATVQTFYGGRRHDLFGIADSVILMDGFVCFSQNCSYGSLKAHRDVIDKSEHKKAMLGAGAAIVLAEWRRKKAGKKMAWFVRHQIAHKGKPWGPVSDWEGPLDL